MKTMQEYVPWAIDFSRGLLSMSSSMEKLDDYCTKIKNELRKKKLNEIKANIKKADYSEESIKKRLGRKWKPSAVEIAKLVECTNWMFSANDICPIACTSDLLVSRFRNCRQVSRAIEKAVKVGVLHVISEFYDYKTGIAKSYCMDREMAKAVVKMAGSKFDVDNHEETEDDDDVQVDESEACEFDESRVRISSRIMMRIDGVPDSKLIEVLGKRYPMYVEGKKIAEKLNKKLCDLEKVKWEWSIRRKKFNGHEYLMKIGFRASNSICSYKEHENENVTYSGKWRKDYLKERFKGGYDEIDVNGSIWRLTYNLNHDVFLPMDEDVYEKVWMAETGEKFEAKEDRRLFKSIAMRIYFGNVSKMGAGFVWTYNDKLKGIGEEELDNSYIEGCQFYFENCKENVGKYLGGYYGSEVFLHESFVYLKILEKLIENGVDVVQVYDGFYVSKCSCSVDLFNKIYCDMLSEYKIKFRDCICNGKLNDDKQIYSYSGHIRNVKSRKSNKVGKINKNNVCDNDSVNDDLEVVYLSVNDDKKSSYTYSGHIRDKEKSINKVVLKVVQNDDWLAKRNIEIEEYRKSHCSEPELTEYDIEELVRDIEL